MYPQPMVFVRPLLLLAALAVGLAHLVWRRYRGPQATWCALLLLAASGWMLGYAFELGSAALSAKVLWAKLQYLPIVMVPYIWLSFVVAYTDRARWLTRRNLALLAVEPLVTLALVWTSKYHGLLYRNTRLDPSGSFLAADYGLWFWVDTAYAYLLLATGSVMLLQQALRPSHPRRRQAIVLLIGVGVPWAVEAVSLSELNPIPYLDLTPFSFMVTGLTIVWGLTGLNLFDTIVPIARDVVIESMSDGLIVMDTHGQVVDMNPAAERIIGQAQAREGADGPAPAQVLFAQPDLMVGHGGSGTRSEIVLSDGEEQRYYDLDITPLRSEQDRLLGQLIHLTDITEHRRAEEERDTLIAQLQEALAQVRALQGLLPVCASCKRIRDYAGHWRQMEEYVSSHSNTEFTHGLCPDCRRKLYPGFEEEG